MDALSEALRAVRMTGAIFLDAEMTTPWGVVVPHSRKLAPVIAPGTEQIVNYHLVLDGEMLVEPEEGLALNAAAGDIVILPSGAPHRLSAGAPTAFRPSSLAMRRLLAGHVAKLNFGGGGEMTRIVCGFLGCDRYVAELILSGLPSAIRIPVTSAAGGDWLAMTIRHAVSDGGSDRAGRSLMLSRIAETLFIESMRNYAEALPAEQTGWLAGARDPLVGRALACLHRETARRWSVQQLAEAAGASRTVLTERFVRILGAGPLAYLARWRMHRAARLLTTTRSAIIELALEVGYESEAAFNRAFKREFGVPPATYRRQAQTGD